MAKLSSKLRTAQDGKGGRLLVYWCPGCDGAHAVPLDNRNAQGALWRWDGRIDAPTLAPSVHVGKGGEFECHHFVTEGQIQYCTDSYHALAGQTVPMVDAWATP